MWAIARDLTVSNSNQDVQHAYCAAKARIPRRWCMSKRSNRPRTQQKREFRNIGARRRGTVGAGPSARDPRRGKPAHIGAGNPRAREASAHQRGKPPRRGHTAGGGNLASAH